MRSASALSRSAVTFHSLAVCRTSEATDTEGEAASNFENLSLMKVHCKFNVYIVLNGEFKNLNFLKNNLP